MTFDPLYLLLVLPGFQLLVVVRHGQTLQVRIDAVAQVVRDPLKDADGVIGVQVGAARLEQGDRDGRDHRGV
jgi:hypothetical protein